jgi:hypothetical protein
LAVERGGNAELVREIASSNNGAHFGKLTCRARRR